MCKTAATGQVQLILACGTAHLAQDGKNVQWMESVESARRAELSGYAVFLLSWRQNGIPSSSPMCESIYRHKPGRWPPAQLYGASSGPTLYCSLKVVTPITGQPSWVIDVPCLYNSQVAPSAAVRNALAKSGHVRNSLCSAPC